MISGMVMGMDVVTKRAADSSRDETGGESRRDEMGGKNGQKGMTA